MMIFRVLCAAVLAITAVVALVIMVLYLSGVLQLETCQAHGETQTIEQARSLHP